jgi:hypothetical protein
MNQAASVLKELAAEELIHHFILLLHLVEVEVVLMTGILPEHLGPAEVVAVTASQVLLVQLVKVTPVVLA